MHVVRQGLGFFVVLLVSHFCPNATCASVTVQIIGNLNLTKSVSACCSAEKWGSFDPLLLRLIVDPTDDQQQASPKPRLQGIFEFCYDFTVEVNHHLSNATCEVSYDSEGKASFSAAVLMRVYMVSYKTEMVSQVTNIRPGVQKIKCAFFCHFMVTFENSREMRIVWCVNGEPDYGQLQSSSTMFLRYIEGKRLKRLQLNKGTSRTSIESPSGCDQKASSLYCEIRHQFEGSLKNSMVLPEPPEKSTVPSEMVVRTQDFEVTTQAPIGSEMLTTTVAATVVVVCMFLISAVVGAIFYCRRRRRRRKSERTDIIINMPPGRKTPQSSRSGRFAGFAYGRKKPSNTHRVTTQPVDDEITSAWTSATSTTHTSPAIESSTVVSQ